MRNIIVRAFLLMAIVSATGCAMTNQDVGTVSGGVIGGLVGSTFGGGQGQLVAIGAGTLVGAYLGGQIGRTMDEVDRARMTAALESNAVGQPAYWVNQRTHVHYNVVPVRNVSYGSNRYCREYRTVADIAGRKQQIYGTACRQPDGTWRVVR